MNRSECCRKVKLFIYLFSLNSYQSNIFTLQISIININTTAQYEVLCINNEKNKTAI